MGAIQIVLHFINLPATVFVRIMELKLIKYAFKHTAFHRHYKEWRKINDKNDRSMNLLIDRFLGILLSISLLVWFNEMSESKLIEVPHLLICKLRELLQALQGNPVGLKLNSYLNNFLFDCFNYHIDLWHKFLDLLTPLISQLYVAYCCVGCLGLSYQLSLLADLIAVVGLHAHCFYVYSDVLYRVMVEGLQVLWRMMLGKRRNMLKQRVEKYTYMDRQLYLATIFFAIIIFLLPTILVYYLVFASLRWTLSAVNWFLQHLCVAIMTFPIDSVFKSVKTDATQR